MPLVYGWNLILVRAIWPNTTVPHVVSVIFPLEKVEHCQTTLEQQKLLVGIKSHDKICLYLVNKSCFAQTDVSLIINIHTISLEYCKIHRHSALACPPVHGTILRGNYTILSIKLTNNTYLWLFHRFVAKDLIHVFNKNRQFFEVKKS